MGFPSWQDHDRRQPRKRPLGHPGSPSEIRIGPGREQGTKAGSWPADGQTTGPTKPNPFDDIARQVIADQEAKDREAGRDDLIPTLAKSVDRAKGGRAPVRQLPSLRSRSGQRCNRRSQQPTKVQANRNGVTFSGRPTTKVETVRSGELDSGSGPRRR